MKRRVLGAVLVGVLVSVPAAADATRWSGADVVGDATSYTFSPEPEPCGTFDFDQVPENDITGLVIRHSRDRVSVTVTVANLQRRRDVYWAVELHTDRRDLSADAWDGELSFHRPIDWSQIEADECGVKITSGISLDVCEGTRSGYDRSAGKMTLSVTRSCLRNPRWVQVGFSVQGAGEDGAFDRWGSDESDDEYTDNLPLTPRIRVPRR